MGLMGLGRKIPEIKYSFHRIILRIHTLSTWLTTVVNCNQLAEVFVRLSIENVLHPMLSLLRKSLRNEELWSSSWDKFGNLHKRDFIILHLFIYFCTISYISKNTCIFIYTLVYNWLYFVAPIIPHFLDHSLVVRRWVTQCSYESCHAGPPKTGGS